MITFISCIFLFHFLLLMRLISTQNMIHIRLDLEDITLNLEFLFLFIERSLLFLELMNTKNLKCNKCD